MGSTATPRPWGGCGMAEREEAYRRSASDLPPVRHARDALQEPRLPGTQPLSLNLAKEPQARTFSHFTPISPPHNGIARNRMPPDTSTAATATLGFLQPGRCQPPSSVAIALLRSQSPITTRFSGHRCTDVDEGMGCALVLRAGRWVLSREYWVLGAGC